MQQNTDLELVCKQALEENKKLQNTLKNQRTSFEKQQQEIQVCWNKLYFSKHFISIIIYLYYYFAFLFAIVRLIMRK